MTNKKYGLSGISASVEIGKNGLRVKNNGSQLEARSNDELSLVEFMAADGTQAQSVVTKSQLDAMQSPITIDAGSTGLLDLTNDVLSVKNLLVQDVHVDNSSVDLATFVGASYTVGNEFQEGDIIILSVSTNAQERVYIHNGGSAGTTADFTRLQVDLSESVIRAMFSAGTGIAYNSSTGEISVDATSAEITADDAGFTVISGATAQAVFASIDTTLSNVSADLTKLYGLFGVSNGDTHLGTFTGSTISDNTDAKTALQELETKIEDVEGNVMSHCRKIAFDYTSGASFNIGSAIDSGRYIKETTVKITTPFNDIAATLEVGKSGDTDMLMGTSANDLQDAGIYGVTNFEVLGADTQILATLSVGTSTQGAGYILVEYC